jgi:hypothetical protein
MSHRTEQYMMLREKLRCIHSVPSTCENEKQEDLLLDEMDAIWYACSEDELDEIKALCGVTRPVGRRA